MDINYLTIYKSPFQKRRVGRIGDGGYVIAMIPNFSYDQFLSGGICNDISFEEDFLSLYPSLTCTAYDGSIPHLPKANSKIEFVKKFIGDVESETYTTMQDRIDGKNNIFLKMDIESGEYPWLRYMDDLSQFSQIVMEFHTPHLQSGNANDVFKKISQTHVLIHLHGNNFDTLHPSGYPNVFECTYLHKKFFQYLVREDTPFPSKLDYRNYYVKEDIDLNRQPFTLYKKPLGGRYKWSRLF